MPDRESGTGENVPIEALTADSPDSVLPAHTHPDDRRPATVCTCGTPRRNLHVRDVCDRCQRPIPLYR